jgi:hypothetical protein
MGLCHPDIMYYKHGVTNGMCQDGEAQPGISRDHTLGLDF